MVKLDSPTASLSIQFSDVMEILESVLEEKYWKDFDSSSVELDFVPFYIFNYDVLVEQEIRGEKVSQGFSGKTSLNAVEADIEPMVTGIMDNQPVKFKKEIEVDYDMYNVNTPAISEDELKRTCEIKLAAQYNVSREDVATSAFRLVYWPIWTIFVKIPGSGVHKLQIDGVRGQPINIEEVPEREKGWVEVSKDTLSKLKSPKGWGEMGVKAARTAAGGVKSTASSGENSGSGTLGLISWLFKTKAGRYTIILLIFLIVIFFLLEYFW
ncbi:MAG: hypothetical protein ACOCTT_02130 [archaeon]